MPELLRLQKVIVDSDHETPQPESALAVLSYAHYGAGVCRFRSRNYGAALQNFDSALDERTTSLSDHTTRLARKNRVYCVYALAKKAIREQLYDKALQDLNLIMNEHLKDLQMT